MNAPRNKQGCGAAGVSHTPGPWHLKPGDASGFKTPSGEPGIYAPARDSDDFFILQIAEMATNVPATERGANARLIASAPELYAALAEWVELVTPTLLQALAAGYPNERHMDLLGRSNIALVKARGELE